MDKNYLHNIIIQTLKSDITILEIELIEDIILVHFLDDSYNSIKIKNLSPIPICEDGLNKGLQDSYTKEEFEKYIFSLRNTNPSLYCLILIIITLIDLDILSFSTGEEILSRAKNHEDALNEFFSMLFYK